jgi:hypothetical protein
MAQNLDLNFKQLIDLGPLGATKFYGVNRDKLNQMWKGIPKYQFIVMICNILCLYLKKPDKYLETLQNCFKVAISLLTSGDPDYQELWDKHYPQDQFYLDIDKYVLDNEMGLNKLATEMRGNIGVGDPRGNIKEWVETYKAIFLEKREKYRTAIKQEKNNSKKNKLESEMSMFTNLSRHLDDLYSLVISSVDVKDIGKLRVTFNDKQIYENIKKDKAHDKDSGPAPPTSHVKDSSQETRKRKTSGSSHNKEKQQKRSTSNSSHTDTDEAVSEAPDPMRQYIEKIAADYGKAQVGLCKVVDQTLQNNINLLREKIQQVTTRDELVPFAYWFVQLTKIPPMGFDRPHDFVNSLVRV